MSRFGRFNDPQKTDSMMIIVNVYLKVAYKVDLEFLAHIKVTI